MAKDRYTELIEFLITAIIDPDGLNEDEIRDVLLLVKDLKRTIRRAKVLEED